MLWNGHELRNGDILLIGRRIQPFFLLKGILKAPLDLLRFQLPSVLVEYGSYRIQDDTRSWWNHAELLFDDDSGYVKSIGAHPDGIKVSNLDDTYPLDKFRIKILRPKKNYTDEELNKVVNYAKSKVGNKYYFWGIIKLKLTLAFKGFNGVHNLTDNLSDPIHPLFCSQLVDQAWLQLDDLLPDVKDFPSPAHLDETSKLETVCVYI